MTLPWKVATVCFLRDGNKTMLMDYRNFPHPIHEGFYSPPGGKVKTEENEDPVTAAKREIGEETGIEVRNLVYRGVIYFLNEKRTIKGRPMKYNFKVYYYDCHDFDAGNERATEGSLEWINSNDVLGKSLHEGDKVIWGWLKQYREIEGLIEQNGERVERAELLYNVPFR